MASTPSTSNAGQIDLTKQAEYPILLGDKLAGKASASNNKLVNVRYNHKPRLSAQPGKAVVNPSVFSQDLYRLSLEDNPSKSDGKPMVYKYRGSVDPRLSSRSAKDDAAGYILVFDPERKAFILEPLSTAVNFNLTSAPGKTKKQLVDEYSQLEIHTDDEPLSGDENVESEEDVLPADSSNPYDFRHFLQKAKDEIAKPATEPSPSPTPDPHRDTPSRSNATSGVGSFIQKPKPKPKPIPRSHPKSSPLLPSKRQARSTTKEKPAVQSSATSKPKSVPKSAPIITSEDEQDDSSYEQERPGRNASSLPKDSQSPNIVVDGDLVIDMGDEPSHSTFDPRYLQSDGEDSADDADASEVDNDYQKTGRRDADVDVEGFELPPPAAQDNGDTHRQSYVNEEEANDEDEDEDDPLAAEMEAAFFRAREEDENGYQQQPYQYHSQVVDSDESEVSEEE